MISQLRPSSRHALHGGYTKHYYIEGQRIVSKLGAGFDNKGQGPLKAGNNKVNYSEKQQALFSGIVRNQKFMDEDGNLLTAGKSGKTPPGQIIGSSDQSEPFRFFYHPDHLGSTSYITDANGEVYQHLEYFAFGETFVEEHSNKHRIPYKFNGKELDEETGLYYYGARYYDAKSSVWLSGDPLTDKYPSFSMYSYSFNNPAKYVDPQGMESEDITDPPKWVKSFVNWFNGDSQYKGSGWGHGFRTEIYNILGLDDKASNIAELGVLSMLQRSEVDLKGDALDKVSNDPDVINYESDLAKDAKNDPKYGKEAFSFKRNRGVQFGGDRAPDDMWDQLEDPFNPKYKDTWDVAANELTWMVRSTTIRSVVSVSKDGKITVTHKFSDVFDLRPSRGRSDAYNDVTQVLGTLYHDVAGGNDLMKVNAKWTKQIK